MEHIWSFSAGSAIAGAFAAGTRLLAFFLAGRNAAGAVPEEAAPGPNLGAGRFGILDGAVGLTAGLTGELAWASGVSWEGPITRRTFHNVAAHSKTVWCSHCSPSFPISIADERVEPPLREQPIECGQVIRQDFFQVGPGIRQDLSQQNVHLALLIRGREVC